MVETLEGHVISEHSNHKRPVLVQHQIEHMLNQCHFTGRRRFLVLQENTDLHVHKEFWSIYQVMR